MGDRWGKGAEGCLGEAAQADCGNKLSAPQGPRFPSCISTLPDHCQLRVGGLWLAMWRHLSMGLVEQEARLCQLGASTQGNGKQREDGGGSPQLPEAHVPFPAALQVGWLGLAFCVGLALWSGGCGPRGQGWAPPSLSSTKPFSCRCPLCPLPSSAWSNRGAGCWALTLTPVFQVLAEALGPVWPLTALFSLPCMALLWARTPLGT